MNKVVTTSVSLPVEVAGYWRKHKTEIMHHAARFLRLCMRKQVCRGTARKYNRDKGRYAIVTTRFTAEEHDILTCVATSLRVSVSSLVYGLIMLWLKPARRASNRFYMVYYSCSTGKWDPEAGSLEEWMSFWRVKSPDDPPPWQEVARNFFSE